MNRLLSRISNMIIRSRILILSGFLCLGLITSGGIFVGEAWAGDNQYGADANLRLEGNNDSSNPAGVSEGVVITSNGDNVGDSAGTAVSYIRVMSTNTTAASAAPNTGYIDISSPQINLYGPTTMNSTLSVSGTITGYLSGNISGSAGSVNAANLTGATIAGGVTASSLTSLGTLTGLSVSGTTYTNGISNGNDGITNAGAISGVSSITMDTFSGINTDGTLTITGNSDSSVNPEEGIVIKSTGIGSGGSVSVLGSGVTIAGGTNNTGALTVGTTLGVTGATTLNNTLSVDTNGATANITNNAGVLNLQNGSMSIGITNAAGHVNGISANTTSATMTGGTGSTTWVVDDNGARLTDSVNGQTFAVDNVGNAAIKNNATVGGTLGVTGATTLNGATSINNTLTVNSGGGNNELTVGTNTVDIGSATSTNTILGTTNINTTSALGTLTTIGNAANTVADQSLQVNGAMSSTGHATIATAANTTNTFGSGINSNNTIGNAGTSVNIITGATNEMTASATNTITGGTGNTITATTGNNAITALAGSNNITANATDGENNIEARYNNIGVTTTTSTNVIGNNNTSTNVNAYGGAGYLQVKNIETVMGTTAGGMVQTNATSATIRAASSNNLATNSSTGIMAINDGGGYTTYKEIQNTGTNTIGHIVDGKEFLNKVNGNLFVDGNVYINGTLDYVSSNSANTTVVGVGGGSSNLPGATLPVSAGTALKLKGSTTGIQTVVDGNGKLTNVTGTATESTASLTLTNGDGNTHGIVVTETQTTISGGRSSSAMTLNDNGATFSDTSNGAPIRVHGVDDGQAPYDAVNVRQLGAGLAMVAGLAALPQVEPGKTFAIGVGTGGYMDQFSLAAGLSARFLDRFVIKAGAAFVPGYNSSSVPVWNAGIQYSF